jgi:predicted membrane-bound spermidine synthase
MEKPSIVNIIPPCQNEGAKIDHYEVTEKDANFGNLRAMLHGDYAGIVKPGKYARLFVNGHGLMMSDTQMEWVTSNYLALAASGEVLVGGLGLGLILIPMMERPNVKRITVIEKYKAVIDLVLPHLKSLKGGDKLEVIEADVLEWKPPKGRLWNYVYFDIWPNICGDNYPEMKKLKTRFRRRLDKTGDNWMGCWRERDCLRANR